MEKGNDTAWLASTAEERKILYKAVKRIIDETPMAWHELYAAALGRQPSDGIGYEDNFRAGKISRKNAALIFRWIRAAHPDHAGRIDAEVAALREGQAHQVVRKVRHDTGPPNDAKFLILPSKESGALVPVRLPLELWNHILQFLSNGTIISEADLAAEQSMTHRSCA